MVVMLGQCPASINPEDALVYSRLFFIVFYCRVLMFLTLMYRSVLLMLLRITAWL